MLSECGTVALLSISATMANKFRQMVSLKKKRFQQDGFDLDLTYITPRIIAFGYPSVGRERVYRNPKEEVIRFYEKYHKGHYWIYNLCAEPERQYKSKMFHDRLSKFQFYDHNAPPLQMMPSMCEHAANWLNEDEENVVGIHCKAGKGRTGVMICILLVYLGMYDTVEEAMEFYGKQRTYNGKGVTIPSQIRYIRYFGSTREKGFKIPSPPMVLVKGLRVSGIEKFEDPEKLHVLIECITNWSNPEIPFEMTPVYNSKNFSQFAREVDKEQDSINFHLGLVPVCGDVKVILFTGNATKKERLCWFWFHTAFVSSPFVLEKHEIDKAAKDDEHFAPNLRFEMDWEACASSELDGEEHEDGDKKKKKKKKKKRPSSDHPKKGDDGAATSLTKSASDSGISRRKKKKKKPKKSGLSKEVKAEEGGDEEAEAAAAVPNGNAEDAAPADDGAASDGASSGDGDGDGERAKAHSDAEESAAAAEANGESGGSADEKGAGSEPKAEADGGASASSAEESGEEDE